MEKNLDNFNRKKSHRFSTSGTVTGVVIGVVIGIGIGTVLPDKLFAFRVDTESSQSFLNFICMFCGLVCLFRSFFLLLHFCFCSMDSAFDPLLSSSPSSPVRREVFEPVHYDVTDYGCQVFHVLTCPLTFVALIPGIIGKKTLMLESEELVLQTECCYYDDISRKPYGEVGSVEKMSLCCCSCLYWEKRVKCPLAVGWGCEGERVDEIVGELHKRMKARGDTGQIQKLEEVMEEVQRLKREMKGMNVSMELLLNHFGLEKPVGAPGGGVMMKEDAF